MTKIIATTQPTARVHKPCAFSPEKGATEAYCREISQNGARRKQACDVCPCPFKFRTQPESRPSALTGMPRMNKVWSETRSTPRPEAPTNIDRMRALAQRPAVAGDIAPKPVLEKPPVALVPSVAPPPALPAVRPKAHMPAMQQVMPDGNAPWRVIFKRIQVAIANAVFVQIPPSRVRAMARQPREVFDDDALSLLEASISEVGQVQPGLVRQIQQGGEIDYELLDGERRWRVVSRLALPVYRAMCIEIDDEAAMYIVSTVMNFNRAGHTPLEIADAIHRLYHELGVPLSVIAQLHAMKPFWAGQMMGLVNLHPRARDLLDPRIVKLEKDRLPVTAAIKLAKLDQGLQLDLANRVIRKEVTLRGLRAEIIRLGNLHGKPVRQRAVNRNHQFASFVAMGRNIRANASDLKALCYREDFPDLILKGEVEQVRNVLVALNEAETEIANAKLAIARAIAGR